MNGPAKDSRTEIRVEETMRYQTYWSDESRWTNCGLLNSSNTVFWLDVNPRLVLQVRWEFNIRLGIVGKQVIGPHFFNEHLNSERYLKLLQTNL